jgi:hypothetical protein
MIGTLRCRSPKFRERTDGLPALENELAVQNEE